LVSPRFDLTPYQGQINAQPFNQFIFRDNSYNPMIILSLNIIQHIIKNNNKLNNT